jgi:hypothetical protein
MISIGLLTEYFETMLAIPWILLAISLLTSGVLLARNRKLVHRVTEMVSIFERQSAAVSEQVKIIGEVHHNERESLVQVSIDRDEWKRRAEQLGERISGILAERDWWNKHYHEQSAQHSAAQALLMREVQRLVTELRRDGKKVDLGPTLLKIVSEFADNHPAPLSKTQ